MERGSSSSSSKVGRDSIFLAAAAAAAAGTAAAALYYKRQRRKQDLPYPPGPEEHPIFGSLFRMPDFANGETFDTMNLENAKRHGLVYSVTLPLIMGRLIVVGDPQLARQILVTRNYGKSFFYQTLAPLVGETSLATMPNGREWSNLRKAFHPGFTPAFLRGTVRTMAGKLDRFAAGIDSDILAGRHTNMLKRSQSYTSDVIVAVAFGEDWRARASDDDDGDDDVPHPARVLEDEICRLYSKIAMNPFRRLFDFRTKREMRRVGVELDLEMRAILDRRLAAQAQAASLASAAAAAVSDSSGAEEKKEDEEDPATDIATLAISHLRGEDGTLTDEAKNMIVDQFKTFYFAGHDTTATTIAWAMWELSRHPEALRKLRAELVEHGIWQQSSSGAAEESKEMPSSPTPTPTYEQLQKCVYLEGVIKEALRLYPPASGISRQTGEDDVAATYNGYSLRNSVLIVNAYVMGRHPDLWKEPDAFKPERFSDGSEADVNAKFLPFSRGPRDCIGKYFALLEAKLAVSALAVRYDLDCVNPKDRIFTFLTNIPEDGAKVRFRPRSSGTA